MREIPALTMTDINQVLESDFQGTKDDKKTSQENLNFIKIIEEGIEKCIVSPCGIHAPL